MSTALQVFDYAEHQVRARESDEGEIIFVAADVAPILGYADTAALTRYLDPDEKGLSIWQTPGGTQRMSHITEEGLYSAIMRATAEVAKPFRRWVTHEVLPAIRSTGSYTLAPQPPAHRLPATFAEALRELADTVEQRDAAQALADQREIPARAWDELATAEGDYSVGDAAKVLNSRAGISTGQNRLFKQMAELGWIYRREGVWHAYQGALDAKVLGEKLNPPRVDRFTGQRHTVPPTIRVTGKGIERLLAELAPANDEVAPLRVVNGGEDW